MDEWEEYLAACQSDLQETVIVMQQSVELSLKSKICRISPFLLLKSPERKYKPTYNDIDFSDFQTLDATDLPLAVNTLCSSPLTENFLIAFSEMRSARNKIQHLGYLHHDFQPKKLLRMLIEFYIELWRDRNWLEDRVRYASRGSAGFFHDGRYSSAEMDAMMEIPYDFALFEESDFQELFR